MGEGNHDALRASHAARARSAAVRAAALCQYIERAAADEQDTEKTREAEGRNIAWKAAHAARVSAQALAVLAESAPHPAADSRCARNAAASAAQAAQMGRLHDGSGDLAVAACEAALKASQAASDAAGKEHLGESAELNARADEAEEAAVAAAERAGWLRRGEPLPEVSTGVRSPELMSMMHL
ncbi:hypothetical protein IPZ68_06285 [Streptomyces arenae]|nr:hypothetical protein [Streptomyces arenae]